MFHPRGPTLAELVRQAWSSTEQGYDLLAPKFEYTPFRTPDELLSGVAPHVGPPASAARSIDLCCGTGAAMRMLRPLTRDEVVGVDFSAGMLDEARRLTADAPGTAALRFVQADVCDLELPDSFDVATCFGALGHIPDHEQHRFAASVRRLLAPGGRFVFVTAERPRWHELRALLSRGFNAAMHLRNALRAPPFVMYYLRFMLPEARELLEQHGFACSVRPLHDSAPQRQLRVVVATRQN